jgi:PIN domain nuclease of toxin-antitoxin system
LALYLVILLDTNALVNALTKPALLATGIRKQLETSSEVYVSSLSFLEIAVKERILGRSPADVIGFAQRSNFHELPFCAKDASHIGDFAALQGHDPFDRAILAQASRNSAILITADKKLLALGLSWVYDSQD